MTRRHAVCGVFAAATMALGALASTPLAGQTPTTTANGFVVGRTADGQPDFQGTWLFFDTIPFEAPGGTRLRKRPGDTVAGENDAARRAAPETPNPFYGEAAQRGKRSNQKAMVVDPPDGHVPVKTAAVDANDRLTDFFYDSYVNIPSGTRCITRGIPGSMFGSAIDNAIQIIQGPEYFSVVHEFLHETRVIPLNGRPHLPQTIRLWTGDSRGHWEGNTLVIDTTNYNNKGSVTNHGGTGYLQGIRQSEALHVVERFTLVSHDTLNYQVTVDDPNVYERPWTVSRTLQRDDKYKMFEYACHEGNFRFMTITLGGGRLRDRGATTDAVASESRKAAEDAARQK
jgi:hypothetical protein